MNALMIDEKSKKVKLISLKKLIWYKRAKYNWEK